jgi:hypothetical protein
MLNFVTENRRTIWSTHIVKDDWRVNFLIALTQLTVSAEMLQLMLLGLLKQKHTVHGLNT